MRALLYTWSTCSSCARARELLERHRVEYREEVLDGDRRTIERLVRIFGQRTMPYVMIDGDPIGGLAELEALAARGELGPDGPGR